MMVITASFASFIHAVKSRWKARALIDILELVEPCHLRGSRDSSGLESSKMSEFLIHLYFV